jgi:hypothetical protein
MAWRDRTRRAATLALLGACVMNLPSALALDGSSGCTSLRGLPINFGVEWEADIKPIFNEMFPTGRCTSCHNAGQLDGGLDLTDTGIDAIYRVVGVYAIPGDPSQSVLFDKINCSQPGHGGARMPFGQSPLSIAEQGLIFDWIEQGALGDVKGEAPIPRDHVFRDGVESLRR